MLRQEFRNDTLLAGPWIEYDDGGGSHYAQPDFIVRGGRNFLIEVKLSKCLDADIQLTQQYLPLCRLLWPGESFRLVAICHNWVGGTDDLIESFEEAKEDQVKWFHWRM